MSLSSVLSRLSLKENVLFPGDFGAILLDQNFGFVKKGKLHSHSKFTSAELAKNVFTWLHFALSEAFADAFFVKLMTSFYSMRRFLSKKCSWFYFFSEV